MGTPKWPMLSARGTSGLPHGRPRAPQENSRCGNGPPETQMESQGSEKESKGSPKRATGGAKKSPRGSWKDAACGPQINGKHKAKQRFVRFGQPVPSQKGSERCPVRDPAARGEPEIPKKLPRTQVGHQKGPQESQKEIKKATALSQPVPTTAKSLVQGGSPPPLSNS